MSRQEIYTRYMERFRKALIENYDKLGLRASGKFADSLEPQIDKNKLIMWGARHAGAMEQGRSANRNTTGELKEAIEEWIEVKRGLPAIFVEKKKQFAFIIARKIAKEGIKVPNKHNKGEVVSDVVTLFLGEYIYQLFDEIGEEYMREFDFESDIKNLLQAS